MLPDTLPDFDPPPFAGAPDARFAPLPADGVLPEGFFSTSNLPTYIKVDGRWLRADPAADGLRGGQARRARSRPSSRAGSSGATWSPWARPRTGPRASWCTPQGFLGGGHGANEFRFMSTEVSRERPVNYEELAARLGEEKRRRRLPRLGGRARRWCTPGRARTSSGSSGNGYVQAVLAGNAVAVHDIEAAIFGTTLGMSNTGQPTEGGHGLHMRAINRVRAAGSIERPSRPA